MPWERVTWETKIRPGTRLKLDHAAWSNYHWYTDSDYVTKENGEYFITVKRVEDQYTECLRVVLVGPDYGTLEINGKAFINIPRKQTLIGRLIKNLT